MCHRAQWTAGQARQDRSGALGVGKGMVTRPHCPEAPQGCGPTVEGPRLSVTSAEDPASSCPVVQRASGQCGSSGPEGICVSLQRPATKAVGAVPRQCRHSGTSSEHLRTSPLMRPWVAQGVQRLTLDLSSGLDLRVVSSSPALCSTLGMEPT